MWKSNFDKIFFFGKSISVISNSEHDVCRKTRNSLSPKNISSNQLNNGIFAKNYLRENSRTNMHIEKKEEKFRLTLNEKIFRQINSLVIPLVNRCFHEIFPKLL